MADTGDMTEGQEPESTDETETPEVEENVDNPADADDTTDEGEDAAEAPKPDKWDGIPEDHWVRSELEQVRREAAQRRTEARELKEKLAGSKSAEDVEQLISDYNEKLAQADLRAAKLDAGREFGLPKELIERLQGSTPEELLADAEKLAPLISKSPRVPAPLPPSGGRNPREGSDDLSPEELYEKTQASKRRRF